MRSVRQSIIARMRTLGVQRHNRLPRESASLSQSDLPYGHAIHKGQKRLEAIYGTEAALLERTRSLV